MKTNSHKSDARLFLAAFGLLLLLLTTCPLSAVAQTNTFPASGNAGIGTTGPLQKLQIGSNTVTSTTTPDAISLGATYSVTARANPKLRLFDNNAGSVYGLGISDSEFDFMVPTGARYSWNINGAEKMRLDTSGNVGIGTASPELRLDARVANTTTDFTNNLTYAGAFGNVSGKRVTIGYDETGEDIGVIQSVHTGVGFKNLSLNPNGGNVGIGTASPGAKLHVNAGGTSALLLGADTDAPTYNVVSLNGNVTDAGHLGLAGGGGTDKTLYVDTPTGGAINFRVNASNKVIIDTSGNVGVGTTAPSATLHVQGTGRFTGNLTVDGSISAKYQDVAEWVESSQDLPAGTVVILDQTKSNQVIASSHAYDTRVAGVISAQPGITLGEKGDNKVLVATTGRVKVRVDASSGPIQVGDLLVTSDIPGVAKKSEPLLLGGVPIHRPGTLIGKALEPLAKGQGEILVLLSLQ